MNGQFDSELMNTKLASLFKDACLCELEALKPGNVHIFADGHGMTVEDFIASAKAASEVIALPNLTVGARILGAVEATQNAVGLNTNLGIILLCAPLIHAVLNRHYNDFLDDLKQTLQDLTIQDAALTFQAIRLANPAGLGTVTAHDVHQPADCTLLVAMKEGAMRDRVASQYANNFHDIFEFGLPRYEQYLTLWQRPAWAVTAVYLGYMAHYADSHIARKHGEVAANLVQNLGQEHEAAFLSSYNPKNYLTPLLRFDTDLKSKHLNPGTSADLTVATLLLHKLLTVYNSFT